jgi:hypothetical protein
MASQYTKLLGLNEKGTHEIIGVFFNGQQIKTLTRKVLSNTTRESYYQTNKNKSK